MQIASYIAGEWVQPDDTAVPVFSALDSKEIARIGHRVLDVQAMLGFANQQGGPALRELSFHQRASFLKQLAGYLNEHKEALTELAFLTGATRKDSVIDIDGGIGTLFVYASKGKRELPDATVLTDGDVEQLSRQGSFVGQHIYTPKSGVAVHINAYNFPVWGMLEKLAPTILAGVPAIIKPASISAYVAQHCFKLIIESEILPPGSVQLISGSSGSLLDHLSYQDSVSFTGSADTALKLKSNPLLLDRSVSFTAEQDSLNATALGEDINSSSPEFDLFVGEVVAEMTAKAGQKCTAIRRIMVPEKMVSNVIDAVSAKLAEIKIGDPATDDVNMGALISTAQRLDVQEKVALIKNDARCVFGDDKPNLTASDLDLEQGAFMNPVLLHCASPDTARFVHHTEAFGPVSTVMGYRSTAHAGQLLNAANGSLVASVFTADAAVAKAYVANSAAYHGRLYFNNTESAAEATGHGSPLPHMTHGGPGRAGGGEELGGIRAVKHYMQRTSIQSSPNLLSAITGHYVVGATQNTSAVHPFRKTFKELQLGDSLKAGPRTITLDDIEQFAHFTGDTFYAHMDEEAAKANPFFPGRVAHGYLLLSFAAGLFVDPAPGPVLANTGLDGLQFQKPVVAGDAISVVLTVKNKKTRNAEYGEVRWHVALFNQDDDAVASYELHTMNAF